ncbi:TIGR02594 family protein [Chachezhania sediminis]|uniref:TIGR02594 family protein n=1 Tax=Chachezhania sediminis TaxID=2599291 RepID=UPI00131CCD56|nr:TIGR02594 family protein [Chachezhania sediminis]
MHKVIDTPWNAAAHAHDLKSAGVETVIRYFNHTNSAKLPEKRVDKAEAAALAEAGLKLVTVFQQRGGSGGNLGDLTAASGTRDAERAVGLAEAIEQPAGSAIYFAVDHDYFRSAELASIKAYFAAVKAIVGPKGYRVGVYGSGTVGRAVRDAGSVDLIWLAAARGWSGTRDMLQTDAWELYQIWPPINDPLPHDGNTVSPAWHDYGQFVPGGTATADLPPEEVTRVPNAVIMTVEARSGLRMRRGPGSGFEVETVVENGTQLFAVGRTDEWVQVDLQGDGMADGFMHGDYLKVVSGGLPAPMPCPQTATSGFAQAYQVANAELALGVKEIAGAQHNPRIVMYHNSTSAGAGTADEVAWCSSFTNYCVEQAGFQGTDSQWALSWESWGQDATADPREGDIVVYERVGAGGHVGFFVADHGDTIATLGGNQSNRVKISHYPKNGKLGSQTYKLRGIRRG